MAEETPNPNGKKKTITIEETGMIYFRVDGKLLELDVFDEMNCIQKVIDPVRDTSDDAWVHEVKKHLKEKHDVNISILAAISYFNQLMKEHERISDFFSSTPASPTSSDSIPEDLVHSISGATLSISEDSNQNNPSDE